MNLAQLQRSIQSGKRKPVYLIHGPEPFLRREAVRLIREAVAAGDDTDVLQLDGAEVQPGALLDDLHTPPLFASGRLVILENAGPLLSQAADLILQYAEKPSSRSVLALVAESVDGRKKETKRLLQATAGVECPAMPARQVPNWCAARARQHGKRMKSDAARLLVDLGGTNLGQLDNHLQGLAAYCRDRAEITAEDVSNLVGSDHARTVWELVRAISRGSTPEAFRTLHRLLQEPKTSVSWIVASLARDTRDLWQVKLLQERGHPGSDIQKRLGKPDWIMRQLADAVRTVSVERLRANHRLLLEADVEAKTGGSDEWILERLVFQLCGPQAEKNEGDRT